MGGWVLWLGWVGWLGVSNNFEYFRIVLMGNNCQPFVLLVVVCVTGDVPGGLLPMTPKHHNHEHKQQQHQTLAHSKQATNKHTCWLARLAGWLTRWQASKHTCNQANTQTSCWHVSLGLFLGGCCPKPPKHQQPMNINHTKHSKHRYNK